MKKVKIMLMSLLLLGVVGGALAFKAKFTADYCSALPSIDAGGVLTCSNGINPLTCPNLLDNSTTTTQGQVFVVCTSTRNAGGTPCPNNKNCGAAVQSMKAD